MIRSEMSISSNFKLKKRAYTSIATSVALFLAVSVGSANAVVVEVGGAKYDVFEISSSFDLSQSLLESQPFFGNEPLAFALADACKECLGMSNGGGVSGAYFATSATADAVLGSSYLDFGSSQRVGSGFLTARNLFASYATATLISSPAPAPVPLPAAGWMLLVAVGGLAGLRRRKKRHA